MSSKDSSETTALEAVKARVLLVDGNFQLPAESKDAFGQVRVIFAKAAQDLAKLLTSGKIKVDSGRLIHALDLIQHAKDTACVSLILPHTSTDPRASSKSS